MERIEKGMSLSYILVQMPFWVTRNRRREGPSNNRWGKNPEDRRTDTCNSTRRLQDQPILCFFFFLTMAGFQRCGSQCTKTEQDHLQQIHNQASQSSCKLCKCSHTIDCPKSFSVSCSHSLELWLDPFPLPWSGSPMYMQTLDRQESVLTDSRSSSQRAASPDHQHRAMLNIRHDCPVIKSIWHKHAIAPWTEPAKELNTRVKNR